MFEKATRFKLRFRTEKGILNVEDLWDLSLNSLNFLAKGINKQLKDLAEEDFLGTESVEDTKLKLSFDIVLHILKTKKEEAENEKNAVKRKAEKEKILGIISKKQDSSLESMSVEDLQKKLNEL